MEILKETLTQLYFTSVGAILLYVAQLTFKKSKDLKSRRLIKKQIKKNISEDEFVNILSIANGDPEFKRENIFTREASILGRRKCLYIDAPEEVKIKIRKKQIDFGYTEEQITKFNKDTSFDWSSNFKDIETSTGISNLCELIEKHRIIVGKNFLSSRNGALFNGIKYGIYALRFTRLGANEDPGIEMDLFETDYFTHRVFRSIYHELKDMKHEMTHVESSNFIKYNPFLTSFGINCLLICNGKNGREIVIGTRSARVHGGDPRFHITMNEGLSQTDKDPFGRISLEECFKRGLLEELGIDNKIYNLASKACLYDFFLERTNFEIGLSAAFEINLSFENSISKLISRDKSLETDKFTTIPLKKNDISAFLNEHKNAFIPHGLYVLKMVTLREGIVI